MTEVALDVPDDMLVALKDDALARQHARMLNLRLTGTLGVLLKAKETGPLPAVAPVLDRLQRL